MSTKAADILALSVAERIQMVEDIWDSIAAVPEAVALSEDQKNDNGCTRRNRYGAAPLVAEKTSDNYNSIKEPSITVNG